MMKDKLVSIVHLIRNGFSLCPLFGEEKKLKKKIYYNVSGIAEGGDYLHNSPSEAQKFNVVQLLISGTSAPTFGNTLLAAGVLKLSK